MKWSYKLGRILGIDVYVHLTLLLLLGFFGLSHWITGGGLPAAANGMLFLLSLFGCVLIHEYGHALMARRYGIPTKDITLLPIGGVARLERMPEKPSQELWVALAGPAVNIVIAAALGLWLSLRHSWEPISALSATQGGMAERLLVVNIFLVLFNMLPAFPMDGGRVLRSLLAMKMNYVRATGIAARIGQGMAVLFGLAGLFGNPMLLLIALFVWMGAAQEAAAAEMKSSATGATVREAMLTDFEVLTPDNTLNDAARIILAGSQRDFPVVSGGEVVGVLSHADLFTALREHGEATTVGAVMRRDFVPLSAGAPLEKALASEKIATDLAMPVVADGRIVGMLTAENIGEFFMIRTALGARPPSRPAAPPVMVMPRVMRQSAPRWS